MRVILIIIADRVNLMRQIKETPNIEAVSYTHLADVIFIKNIDNVVPDRLKEDTVTYKKLIAGVLVTLQKQVFEYLELLDGGKYTHAQL